MLGYRPDEVEFFGLGLNHATLVNAFHYCGPDGIALMEHAYDRVLNDPLVSNKLKRTFRLAKRYGRLPNEYMQYYYFPEETVNEALAAPLSRAEVIMEELPDIFSHYREQAEQERPHLTHTRGGTGFGEFAVDIIAAIASDSGLVEMINIPSLGAFPAYPPSARPRVALQAG